MGTSSGAVTTHRATDEVPRRLGQPLEDFDIREPRPFRHLEGMIGVLDDDEPRIGEPLHHRGYGVGRRQPIPSPCKEELRRSDPFQMVGGSWLPGAHRYQRIAEIHQTCSSETGLVDEMRPDPAAHGLTRENHHIDVASQALRCRQMDLEQPVHPVRRLPALGGVCVIERHHGYARGGNEPSHGGHPLVLLADTGAVGEQDTDWAVATQCEPSADHVADGTDLERSRLHVDPLSHDAPYLHGYRCVMIIVHETSEQVANAAAAAVAWQVASQPNSTIGLAGGSTPRTTYGLLRDAKLDWSGVTLWLGDERWVPNHHDDANTRMVRDALGPAGDRLVVPNHSLDDPHSSAADYTARVLPHMSDGRADLVLLGMGDDGHTASLFPGTAALDETTPGFVASWIEDKSAWRLTATLPLLCQAHAVVFIVTGEDKADMLHRILGHHEPLPAQLVAACNPNTTWLVDQAAAARLG